MKYAIQLMFGLIWVITLSSAQAAEGVAIIPLASGNARGENKQVQYNDNGKLAGSEMYYDKANQRFGVGTNVPANLIDVTDTRSDYLVSIHNTGTGSQARGLLVQSDGGDPFGVKTGDGNFALGIDKNKNTYMFGSSIILGDLAVGVLPSFKLTVNGSAGKPGGGSWSALSDQRLKKNIGNLQGALDKISRLQGVSYEWINPEEHGTQTETQAGFLAQEVETIFPSWVEEVAPTGRDSELVGEGEKVKALSLPTAFNAYLVEAIKELRAENMALKQLVCADHPEASLCQ